MTNNEQTNAFADDIDKLIERYRQEFEMTYAQIVGVLHMKSWLLRDEASQRDD